jgi:hypothetical protein
LKEGIKRKEVREKYLILIYIYLTSLNLIQKKNKNRVAKGKKRDKREIK